VVWRRVWDAVAEPVVEEIKEMNNADGRFILRTDAQGEYANQCMRVRDGNKDKNGSDGSKLEYKARDATEIQRLAQMYKDGV